MGTGFLFGGEANVLKSDSNDGCTTLDILKMTELHTLKGVGFTVCGLYFNKALTKQVTATVSFVKYVPVVGLRIRPREYTNTQTWSLPSQNVGVLLRKPEFKPWLTTYCSWGKYLISSSINRVKAILSDWDTGRAP